MCSVPILLLAVVAGAGPSIRPADHPVEAPVEKPAEKPAEDVDAQLARLESPLGRERLDAQRWLGVHLAVEDLPRVAEAIRAGDAEVRRRLAQAMGSEDRHLGLAALVATDHDREVAAVGRRAVGELVAAWSSSARDAPLRRRRLPDSWSEDFPRVFSVELGADPLHEVVDRLDRLGSGPAPVVLDPSLDPRVAPRGDTEDAGARERRRVEGTWSNAVEELARRRRVSFEVLGHREDHEDDSARARPWVRVCIRGDEDTGDSARHVVDWCVGVLREYDPHGNAACARALGSLGWPAALAWLERRWLADDDPAALEGLLVAAERGRVVPALARPDAVRRVLAGLDARAARDPVAARGHAERCARGLGAVGPLGVRGTALAPSVLAGFAEAGSLGRWARLVALELQGRRDADAEAACRELLGRTDAGHELRWQALRTLHRVGDPGVGVEVAGLAGLLDRAAARGEAVEAGWLLVALGVVPAGGPSTRSEADRLGPGRGSADRAARVVWALTRGDRALADGLLAAALDARAGDELADGLRAWIAYGWRRDLADWLATVASSDAGLANRAGFTRLQVRAGCADEASRAAWLASLPADPAGESLLDLGELAGCAGPAGDEAREVLARIVVAGREDPRLRAALERALSGLRRRPEDGLLEPFLARLRSGAARRGHSLAAVFFAEDWPPPPPRREVRLEALDRAWTPER